MNKKCKHISKVDGIGWICTIVGMIYPDNPECNRCAENKEEKK